LITIILTAIVDVIRSTQVATEPVKAFLAAKCSHLRLLHGSQTGNIRNVNGCACSVSSAWRSKCTCSRQFDCWQGLKQVHIVITRFFETHPSYAGAVANNSRRLRQVAVCPSKYRSIKVQKKKIEITEDQLAFQYSARDVADRPQHYQCCGASNDVWHPRQPVTK
jgi:hypothetical protein